MFFTEPYVEFDLTCRFRDSKDTTEMRFDEVVDAILRMAEEAKNGQ